MADFLADIDIHHPQIKEKTYERFLQVFEDRSPTLHPLPDFDGICLDAKNPWGSKYYFKVLGKHGWYIANFVLLFDRVDLFDPQVDALDSSGWRYFGDLECQTLPSLSILATAQRRYRRMRHFRRDNTLDDLREDRFQQTLFKRHEKAAFKEVEKRMDEQMMSIGWRDVFDWDFFSKHASEIRLELFLSYHILIPFQELQQADTAMSPYAISDILSKLDERLTKQFMVV